MALPNIPGINTQNIWGQANQQAQGIYGPLLAQIAAQYDRDKQEAINRQAQMASATDQAYQSARPQVEQLWQQAIQEGQNLETSVADRLKGVGEKSSADYQQRLAGINAPTGAGIDLQGIYSGASGAGYAKGMNDVSRLQGRKAESLDWLTKAPGLARQQSQGELAQALNDLYKGYQDKSGDLTSHIPGEVQNIYDKLYGQATDERNTRVENAWKQVQYYEETQQRLAQQKAAAQALGQKKEAARIAAQQKQADRELSRWKAELQAETTQRGQDITARGQDMTDARARDPKLHPPAKPGGDSDPKVQRRLKMNHATAILQQEFYNGKTRNYRDKWVEASTGMGKEKRAQAAAQFINMTLTDSGIDPNSKEGRAIKVGWLKRLGIKNLKR